VNCSSLKVRKIVRICAALQRNGTDCSRSLVRT